VIPARVDYIRPSSLAEALEALGAPDSQALAGGQSLVPAMKLRLARPALLVDLAELNLRELRQEDGAVSIGALATWDELAQSEQLKAPELAAVSECAGGIGDLQVRNLGTLGGGLAHADPASDMPAVAMALSMRLAVRSSSGERTIPAEKFFLGPFTTALEPGELITGVTVPLPPPGSGSAYVSVEHPASGFALAGAAALTLADGTSRVAVTGVGGRPFLSDSDETEAEVSADRFAPAEYRRHLMEVVVRRAVELARRRAEEAHA
jgi:carbon-monoxide dehydrogenase medium subunit